MATYSWEWELYWDLISIDGVQPMSAAVRMGLDYCICREYLCFEKRVMDPETNTLAAGVRGSRKHLKGTPYDVKRRERMAERAAPKDFEE